MKLKLANFEREKTRILLKGNFQTSIRLLVSYAAVLCLVTQRSSPRGGGALRDETKNGCVGDYPFIGYFEVAQ